MPSRHQAGSREDARKRFPEIEARVGYDPVKYLDANLDIDEDDEFATATPIALIKGLDSLQEVQDWLTIELELDRGPREPIIAALNERKHFLEEHGDAPTTYPVESDDDPERFRRHDRSPTDAECYIVRNGERIPYEEARGGSATAKLAQRRDSTGSETTGGAA